MMYNFLKKTLILCLVLTLLCTGCAGKKAAEQPKETPAPAVIQTPAPTEAPPAESPAPEEEASLPTPPDVDISSWEFLYASINNGVSRYAPPALAIWDNQYMDSRCMDQTIAFVTAAREQGYNALINCGFRNWEYRINWFERYINEYGSAYEAAKYVFPAGCSEHATGLALDITDEIRYQANYNEEYDPDIAGTELYNWMVEHCADYGFILRYPEGHEEHYERACFNAAHFRYVGVEAAKYITENELCFEEFLALYE